MRIPGMLGLAVVATLVGSLPVAVMAQSPAPAPASSASPAPHHHRSDYTKRIKDALAKLTLNADQKGRTDKILLDKTLNPQARRAAIRKVLTAEQGKQFDVLLPPWHGRPGHGGGHGPAPSGSPSASPSGK